MLKKLSLSLFLSLFASLGAAAPAGYEVVDGPEISRAEAALFPTAPRSRVLVPRLPASSGEKKSRGVGGGDSDIADTLISATSRAGEVGLPFDRSTHHSRGQVHPLYVPPQCTGRSETIRAADGTEFRACLPTDRDRAFGFYEKAGSSGEDMDSIVGSGMVAQPADAAKHGTEIAHAMKTVREFAEAYKFSGPGGVGIGTFLEQILIFNSINGYEGLFYFEPGTTLWTALPTLSRAGDTYLRTLHHEFAHLLQENVAGPSLDTPFARNWNARWKAALPSGWVYKRKYMNQPLVEFTRGMYSLGALTGYSRSSLEEDVAQFGSLLVIGHPEVWRCYEASEVCKAKVELVIELYGRISPRYNAAYFRTVHTSAARVNRFTVREPGVSPTRDEPFGSDYATDEKAPTWDEYVEKLSEVPPRQGRAYDPKPPSFSVEPEVFQIGPDSVRVYFETKWTQYFYGNTLMSRMSMAYGELPPENIPRARRVIERWSRLVSHGLGGALGQVAVADRLRKATLYGVFFEDPGDTVWLANTIPPEVAVAGRGWDTELETYYVQTLCHEMVHLLADAFYIGKLPGKADPVDWRRRWIRANEEGFQYLGAGSPGMSLYFDEKLFKSGFISGYNRASINEDIAQFGAAALLGDRHVWDCAAASEHCARKLDLVVELFSQASPAYTKAFFRTRAGRPADAGADKLQAEVGESQDVTSEDIAAFDDRIPKKGETGRGNSGAENVGKAPHIRKETAGGEEDKENRDDKRESLDETVEKEEKRSKWGSRRRTTRRRRS